MYVCYNDFIKFNFFKINVFLKNNFFIGNFSISDNNLDPYKQYMKVVDCYELAPHAGRVILVDSKVKVNYISSNILINF